VKYKLLVLLCCPNCRSDLLLVDAKCVGEEVESGDLRCTGCGRYYPIVGYVPRFVPTENYAGSFGFQWNRFRRTQLASFSGLPISRDRFFRQTGWSPMDIAGKSVLDLGCGAGRFSEVALSCGATVVAVDYSSAVDACWQNLRSHLNFHVIQADIYTLPLRPGKFEFVYCLGVLQHTPDVKRAVMDAAAQIFPQGRIVVDVYPRNIRSALHPKTWLRPITTRIDPVRLFSLVERATPSLLSFSRRCDRVPVMGRYIRRLVPVANYEGVYPLSENQLLEWATLDTYDMLSPRYDQPQTPERLYAWLTEAGLEDVEVIEAGLLTGRGRKPALRAFD